MSSKKKRRSAPVVVEAPPASAFSRIQPWLTLILRVGLAGVMIWAGATKITDLDSSVRAVAAYQLLPEGLVTFVGYGLPVFEIILGLLLLAGLFTRWMAVVNGLVMVAFMIGIASAWARGLKIDCGCFGQGGPNEAVDASTYALELGRDLLFLAGSAFVAIWPRSRFSADHALSLD